MISKTIHFIFGLAENYNLKPFCLIHYLAILSAKKVNPDYNIKLHYLYNSKNNVWWDMAKEQCTFVKIENFSDYIYEQKAGSILHISDFLRLNILENEGGIYLDMDVLCISSFDELLNNKFVMGHEISDGNINGLCNAVILSEPGAKFIGNWKSAYKMDYDPKLWEQMSVRKPHALSQVYPNDISILSSNAFFKFDWTDIIYIFDNTRVVTFDGCYTIHLWESMTYNPILRHITANDILTRDCLFNRSFRELLS